MMGEVRLPSTRRQPDSKETAAYGIGDWAWKPSYPYDGGEVIGLGKVGPWDALLIRRPDGRQSFILVADAQPMAKSGDTT